MRIWTLLTASGSSAARFTDLITALKGSWLRRLATAFAGSSPKLVSAAVQLQVPLSESWATCTTFPTFNFPNGTVSFNCMSKSIFRCMLALVHQVTVAEAT
jgi:hypothetical protein